MSDSDDATVTFTAGRYEGGCMRWHEGANAPAAAVSLVLFRTVFDAAGEETIDTTGDIDPGILLGVLDLGPRGAEETTTWVRLVARWARQRGLRVGFAIDEPTGERRNQQSACC